uniref:Uncharacterized protein n=1 Tax=Ditylenchus dipsaci TaxID=166011 RepID=A0A915EQ18_9BILA
MSDNVTKLSVRDCVRSSKLPINMDVVDINLFKLLCLNIYQQLLLCGEELFEFDVSSPIHQTVFWDFFNANVLNELAELFSKENLMPNTVKLSPEVIDAISPILKRSQQLNYIDISSSGLQPFYLPACLQFLSFNIADFKNGLADIATFNTTILRGIFTYIHQVENLPFTFCQFYEEFLKKFPNIIVDMDGYMLTDWTDFCQTVQVIGRNMRFLRITPYQRPQGFIFDVTAEILDVILYYCPEIEYVGFLVENSFSRNDYSKLARLEHLRALELNHNDYLDDDHLQEMLAGTFENRHNHPQRSVEHVIYSLLADALFVNE